MTENSLIIFTRASQMLAEADTIQKTKELKDMAIVAGEWARRKDMGIAAIRHCRSYALEAERKMGEMLARPENKAQGKRTDLVTSGDQVGTPTHKDIGLTKRASSEAQMLARLDRPTFEAIRDGKKRIGEVRREIGLRKVMESVKLPNAKYRVIYADPPWKYGDQLMEKYGATRFHYPSMTIKQLCDLPVLSILESDAVLFLWVTSPLLDECWPVIRAWGFQYKTSFVWDKIKHNIGHYNSVRHEFLLVCTRGSCLPDNKKQIDSVQSIERTAHSKKPDEFRALIDDLYPLGKRIELFARQTVKNWDRFGNEC